MKNGQLTAIEEGSAVGIILSPSERVVLVAGVYKSTDNLSLQYDGPSSAIQSIV